MRRWQDVHSEAERLIKEREVCYGSREIGIHALGRMFDGILTSFYRFRLEPLPDHVVDLMMVAIKIARAAQGTEHYQDNYVDAENYLRFAFEASLRERELNKEEDGPNDT